MALVTSSQFDLGKGLLGEAQNFTNLYGSAQQNQLRGLMLQQQQEQAERERQVRGLLSTSQEPIPSQQDMASLAVGGTQETQDAIPQVMTQDEKIELARHIDPAIANKIIKDLGIDEESKRAEMSRFAAQLETIPFNERPQFIKERAINLESQGRDATHTRMLLDMDEQMQNKALLGVQLADLSTKDRLGMTSRIGGSASMKSFAPVTIVDKKTGEKRLVSPTVDPRTGKATLNPFDIPEGFEISKETDAEKRAADVVAAQDKAAGAQRGKTITSRRAEAIDRGMEAADAIPNVRRGIELLNRVETGGIDAVSLRAKQLFGIEGEDEGELSNRLGKAVLSQLRATFGAAFTEKEGAKLDRIEAGFGKSTAANKRLLEQTMAILRRATDRGIRSAELEGDYDSADEIRRARDFILSDDMGGGDKGLGIPTPQTEAEYNAIPSGTIYIDPEDGKKYRKP